MRKYLKKNQKLELDSQECELFLNAFFQGEIPKVVASEVAKIVEAVVEDERELFLRAFEHEIPKANREKRRALHVKANSSHKKKMTDGVIDLHGLRVEEATAALRAFLQDQIKRGHKKLLVIHGKGSGILRNAVWAFIEHHPAVDDFQVAVGKMGGEGALLVRINQRVRK